VSTITLLEVRLAWSVPPLAFLNAILGVVIVAPNFKSSHSAAIPNFPENLTAQKSISTKRSEVAER